jgi:hypothetical protein
MHENQTNKTVFSSFLSACVACSFLSAFSLSKTVHRSDAVQVLGVVLIWMGLVAFSMRRTRSLPRLFPVLLLGLATRAPFWFCAPSLSDDSYRYVWEGWLVSNLENPFIHSANGPLRLPGIQDLVNHGDMTSIYPPLALWLFGGIATLSTSLFAFQLAATLMDLVTVALLWWAAKTREAPAWCGVIYAVHPLPCIESGLNAHLEVFALPFAVGGGLLFATRISHLATLPVIASAAIKLFPVLLLPILYRREPWRQLPATLLGLFLLLLLSGPFLGAGWAVFDSWQAYQEHWQFNPLLFPLAQSLFPEAGRSILLLLGGLCTLIILVKENRFEAAWLRIALLFLILSPTVHPWYALWLLVPAVLDHRPAWVFGSGFFLFSYAVLAYLDPLTGSWTEPPWLAAVSWLPAALSVALIPKSAFTPPSHSVSGSPTAIHP